ncbi:MAG: hypothetical protein RMJ44_04800, partial [Cytophagales bacterium]|nr:hypothetical protein [Cytophagales bacterium]
FSSRYNGNYLFNINNLVNSIPNNELVASITASQHRFESTPLLEQLGEYFLLMRPNIYTSTISTFELVTDSRRRQKDLSLMAFTQFVNRQKAEGTFQSIAQSQADFIRKHRIRYLIASKSAVVPPTIQPMITDSIVDSKSGERFYLLKP